MSGAQEAVAAEALLFFARLVARCIVEEQRVQSAGMIDQTASPLGARRHLALVRRLVAEGIPEAAIVGRRFLVTKAALSAELATITKRSKGKKPAVRDELAPLRAKYGWEKAS